MTGAVGAARHLGTVCRARSSRVPEATNSHPRAQEPTLENPGPHTLAARGLRSSPRQRRGSVRRRPRRMEADTADAAAWPPAQPPRAPWTPALHQERHLPPPDPSRTAPASWSPFPTRLALHGPTAGSRATPTSGPFLRLAPRGWHFRRPLTAEVGAAAAAPCTLRPASFRRSRGFAGMRGAFGRGSRLAAPHSLLFFRTGGGAIGGWGTVSNPARGADGEAFRPPRNGRRHRHSRFSRRATAIWERRGGPALGCRPSKPLLPRSLLRGGPGGSGVGVSSFFWRIFPRSLMEPERENTGRQQPKRDRKRKRAPNLLVGAIGALRAGWGFEDRHPEVKVSDWLARGLGVPLLGLTHPVAPALQYVKWE